MTMKLVGLGSLIADDIRGDSTRLYSMFDNAEVVEIYNKSKAKQRELHVDACIQPYKNKQI